MTRTGSTAQTAGRAAEQAAGRPGTRRRVGESLARARTLWRDLTGESAYERYLARYAREHAGCPSGRHGTAHESGHESAHGPMSEREFWRARARQAETEISTGCC